MQRIIELSTASGIDLDIFGGRCDMPRAVEHGSRESDSDYRARIERAIDERRIKNAKLSDTTMRDHFALEAMKLMGAGFSHMTMEDLEASLPMVAKASYSLADAMLAERAK